MQPSTADDLGVTPGTGSPRVRAVTESSNAHRTVVVGTDGSESSLRAVARAGSPTVATRRSQCGVVVVHTSD